MASDSLSSGSDSGFYHPSGLHRRRDSSGDGNGANDTSSSNGSLGKAIGRGASSSGVSGGSGSPRVSLCSSEEANNAIDYDTATLKRRSKIRAEEKAAAR